MSFGEIFNLDCRVCKTYQEMVEIPTLSLKKGEVCYCQETSRKYQWLGSEIGWMERPEEEPHWKMTGKSLELKRNDGSLALKIYLDDDENANLVFYNNEGKAVGVLNQKLFE